MAPIYEHFLTYCVMSQKDVNYFGHAFGIISRLNRSDSQAQVEVIDAIGFYGNPLDKNQIILKKCLPVKLFSPGHVVREHLRFICDESPYLQSHRTWSVELSQIEAFVSNANQQRGRNFPSRDFQSEYDYWQQLNKLKRSSLAEDQAKLKAMALEERAQIDQAQGMYFNMFSHSCMIDVKKRLQHVGVKTPNLDRYPIPLPLFTSGKLIELKMRFKEGRLFWSSPLVNENPDPAKKLSLKAQMDLTNRQSFMALFTGVKATLKMLVSKRSQLKDNGKRSKVLDLTHRALIDLKLKLNEISVKPNLVTADLVQQKTDRFREIIHSGYQKAKEQQTQSPLVVLFQKIIEIFNETLNYVKSYFKCEANYIHISPLRLLERACEELTHDEAKPKHQYKIA